MPQKLGQHFLKNQSAAKKIVAALELEKDDTIIEIGPGRGALTIPLAGKCQELGCRITAIEKDPRLAENLGFRMQNWGNIKIIHGDALKILSNPKSYILGPKSFKVAGNIPYYITGKLLRILSELEHKPKLTILTIQKEVAERIVAQPPKMNLLAAAVQFWAEPKIIMNLKPKDFRPSPKVGSAIVKLETKQRAFDRLDSKEKELEFYYYKMIKAIFKQPRKTILNNLSTGAQISKNNALKTLKKVGLTGQERPQNLLLEVLISLNKVINN